MTLEELKGTKVDDLVYISKVFGGMNDYYFLTDAQIPLQVGNMGVVVSRVIGKTAKYSSINLKFETLNKDAPIISVPIEFLERVVHKQDCLILCKVKHLQLAKDTTASLSPAAYNNVFPTLKPFRIGETHMIRYFSSVGKGASEKRMVGLLQPQPENNKQWWYVGIEYVTLCVNDDGSLKTMQLFDTDTTTSTAITATGIVTKTTASAAGVEAVKYCTPIEALQKACNGIKIGDTITYIPDDDTAEFMGITEAYVVTNEHIYMQLTDGNIVRVDKIKDKKGEQ